VLHAMTRFQSPTWHKAIIIALEKAAEQVAFGDDKRKTTTYSKANWLNRSRATGQQRRIRLKLRVSMSCI
ncbi:putative tail stability protein, partial [Escherichia coli O26:H11 str. CVM10021]